MRWRLAPSVFFMSLFCLNVAKDSTPSATPLSATFLMTLSDSSHLDPKLVARSDSVSFVCALGMRVGTGSVHQKETIGW